MVRLVRYAIPVAGLASLAFAMSACNQSDRPTLFDPPPAKSSRAGPPARSLVDPVYPGDVVDVTDMATSSGRHRTDSLTLGTPDKRQSSGNGRDR